MGERVPSDPNEDLAQCSEGLTEYEELKRALWGDKTFEQSAYWAKNTESHWVDANSWRCICTGPCDGSLRRSTFKSDAKESAHSYCYVKRPGEWKDWRTKVRRKHETLRKQIWDIRKTLRTKGNMPPFK